MFVLFTDRLLPLECKLHESRVPGCHSNSNHQCTWVSSFEEQVLRFIVENTHGKQRGGRRQGESSDPRVGLMPMKGERKGRKVRLEDSQTTVQL